MTRFRFFVAAALAWRFLHVFFMPFNALNDAEMHLAMASSLARGEAFPLFIREPTLFHLLAAPFVDTPTLFVYLVNAVFVFACYYLVQQTSKNKLHFLLLALNPLTLIYGASFYTDLLATTFVVFAVAMQRAGNVIGMGLAFLAAFATRLNGLLPAFPVFAEQRRQSFRFAFFGRAFSVPAFHAFYWPFVALILVAYTLYVKYHGALWTFDPNPVLYGLTGLFLLPLLRLPPRQAWERGLFILVPAAHMMVMSGAIQARYLMPFLPLLFDGIDWRKNRVYGLVYLFLGLAAALAFLAHFNLKPV